MIDLLQSLALLVLAFHAYHNSKYSVTKDQVARLNTASLDLLSTAQKMKELSKRDG